MTKLTQIILLKILNDLIKDDNFTESLAKSITSIFDITPPTEGKENPFDDVINRIVKHQTSVEQPEIPGLRNILIGMLKEKRFYAFTRILRQLQDLYAYPTTRIMNYLKQIKFQTKPTDEKFQSWLDIQGTAQSITEELHPMKLSILAELSSEERYLLQGFSPKQIQVMSKFSAKGIDVLSRIGRLSPDERSMILSLDVEESQLFEKLGYREIHSISNLPEEERKRFVGLDAIEISQTKDDPRKQLEFLEKYSGQLILEKLIQLDPKDLKTLQRLIERVTVTLEAGELAGYLTLDEINTYSNLYPDRIEVLNNLNDDDRSVVSNLSNFNQVFQILDNLTSSQRDLILSLDGREIKMLIENGHRMNFKEMGKIVTYGPKLAQRSIPLNLEEVEAIVELTQEQRTFLAEAYELGPDGLSMIRHLGQELSDRVLSRDTVDQEFTVLQRALKKKISGTMIDIESSPLFGMKDILLNLSWKGIELLRRFAEFLTTEIEIIERLSHNGLEVLIDNEKLRRTEILMLGELNQSEGEVLINLSINQRRFLSRIDDYTELPPFIFQQNQRRVLKGLTKKGHAVLQRIVPLTSSELNVIEGYKHINSNFLGSLSPRELDLMLKLTAEEINSLPSFMVWQLGESLIFTLLRNAATPIVEILNSIPPNLPSHVVRRYIPLVSGGFELFRLDGAVTDDYVKTLPSLIGEKTYSLIFKVNLLKFSIRDSSEFAAKLLPDLKTSTENMVEIFQADRIRTIEDLTFIGWILSKLSTIGDTVLGDLCRVYLITLTHNLASNRELKFLQFQMDEIREGFRELLKADRYVLASSFFLSIGEKNTSPEAAKEVKKILTGLFDSKDCFEFLKSPATEGFIGRSRDQRYPDILGRFTDPIILEVSLYYNCGDVIALSEKLDKTELWNLINRRSFPLLRMMARNHGTNLIELYGKVDAMKQLIKSNRVRIFDTLMTDLKRDNVNFSFKEYLHIARGIRDYAYWDGFVGRETYIRMISEFVEFVRSRMNDGELRTVVRNFITDDVNRKELKTRLGVSQRDMSCAVMRKRRDLGTRCVDSMNTKELTLEEKQRILRFTLDETESKLYNELLEYSEIRFQGEQVDPKQQFELISKMKKIPTDRKLMDIVGTLRDPKQFDTILRESGMLSRIDKAASRASLVLTVFFIGKHLAHGDTENLAYDVLNLFVMPIIGERIENLLQPYHPNSASIIGRMVSNFVAFLGLAQGVIARKNAVDELDKDIADLNIVTNAVVIVANIPSIATRIIASLGPEVAIVGMFGIPGLALTVGVVVGSYLINIGLEVKKITQQLDLSFEEKLEVYWEFLLDNPVPKRLQLDIEATADYTAYIGNYLHRLREDYDKIAVSLPSFFTTDKKSISMDFGGKVRARQPFSTPRKNSRLIPGTLDGYDLVCGPSADDVVLDNQKLFIPSHAEDDCVNMVSYRRHGSLNSKRAFFHIASDAWIELSNDTSMDIVFDGKELSVTGAHRSSSRYFIKNQLDNCTIHKYGENFYYVKGESFKCDFGEQRNTVIIEKNFTDSKGIDSIVGSKNREKIVANHAEFVDGKGGADIVLASQKTIVKGYFNDFVIGGCTVLLPVTVDEIVKIVIRTHMIVHGKIWSLEIDGNARLVTADNFLITPIRISNTTGVMSRAYLTKTFDKIINPIQEMNIVKNLTIPSCKLVKQMFSFNYNIIISDLEQNVFNMDKNNHGYVWKTVDGSRNLYIIKKLIANVTIAGASGVIDLQDLNLKPDGSKHPFYWDELGLTRVIIGGLNINLIGNNKNLTFTYDGKRYYKIENRLIKRDFCSHSLPIVGRKLVDQTDFHTFHNCFEFASNRVEFLRANDDLVLVSGNDILIVGEYYTALRDEMELALTLNGEMMEPPVFEEKSNNPLKLISYDVGNFELIIYHNQPDNERHIGYLDLKHRIDEVEISIEDNGLWITSANSTLVQIENWLDYQPARKMMFAFVDGFLPNVECIASICDPNDIVEEFKILKGKTPVASSADRSSSWINGFLNAIIDPIKNLYLNLTHSKNRYSYEFAQRYCATGSNISLGLLLFQTFLDRKCPLPKTRTPELDGINFAVAFDLTEEYERLLENHKNRDSFELYSRIVELVRNERYDSIAEIFDFVSN